MRKERKSKSHTHPKHTNHIPRTIRRPIRLNHAKHAMQLPANEKDEKEMMRVPKLFKALALALFHRVPDHDAEGKVHDPAGRAGSGGEVGRDEGDDALARVGRARVGHGEFGEIDHMCCDVNHGPKDDGPGGELVQVEVLVEWDEFVHWCATEEGDEVSADGDEDEYDVYVEDESCRASNG